MMRPALIQTQWARILIETLHRCGVELFVVCPGSRSAPLALACANLPTTAQVEVIIDERSAGFFALGAARATGKPSVVICTSGTAAAHLFPAVIEATAAGVPLIVVSADRPAELQHCGAPQTISQDQLFGVHAQAAFSLGTPDGAALAMRGLRRTVAQAVAVACGAAPGAVQLNVPLRKPLEPASAHNDAEVELVRQADSLLAKVPVVESASLVAAISASTIAGIKAARRGIIAVATTAAFGTDVQRAVAALAAATGFVVIAESGSQLRRHATVACHDAICCSSAVAQLEPDVILQIGGELTSSGWIAARVRWTKATSVLVAAHRVVDPHSQASAIIVGDVAASLERIAQQVQCNQADSVAVSRASYRNAWSTIDGYAVAAIQTAMAEFSWSEHAAVASALHSLPLDAGLVVGNSLPIRVVDAAVVPAKHNAAWVTTQRGANGIDGLIAGAAGAVSVRGKALLVLGDVSFAHDIGSLMLLQQLNATLVVLVIDNRGGRIFDTLPVAESNDSAVAAITMAKFFTTAPTFNLAAVARAFNLPTSECATPVEVERAVNAAFARTGASIVVARCEPTGAHHVQQFVVASIHRQLEKDSVEKS
jgi:2-succinyl-5-enolpyruvyl-6-hydroxy-3-cyclohexene-1-carboxylate synthase